MEQRVLMISLVMNVCVKPAIHLQPVKVNWWCYILCWVLFAIYIFQLFGKLHLISIFQYLIISLLCLQNYLFSNNFCECKINPYIKITECTDYIYLPLIVLFPNLCFRLIAWMWGNTCMNSTEYKDQTHCFDWTCSMVLFIFLF